MEEFKSDISVFPPKFIEESGEIYAYKDYIFINDKYKGIHIIETQMRLKK